MYERVAMAPPELQRAILQSFLVKRYGAYEEGIFYDSTGHHTLRCIDIVNLLPEGNYYPEKVRRYVWSHDLPEIVTSDFTAIQKEDRDLSRQLEISEREAAQEILPEKYQIMLEEFNKAGKLLRGEDLEEIPPPEAVIAKVVDIVENDRYFHQGLANWTLSEQYDPEKVPNIDALSYTFRHSPVQIQSIINSEYDDEIKELCLMLLRGKLHVIQESWGKVPKNLVPKTIREGLISVEALLEAEDINSL